MATSNRSTGALQKQIESTEPKASQPSDPEQMLDSIMEGIAETVLDASDDDILAETRERGIDPSNEANSVRLVLLEALRRTRLNARDDLAPNVTIDKGKS